MNKLYVGNLSPSVTVEDLKQLFGERKLPVTDEVLLKSGYAFVDFPDQNWAIKAIETLSGKCVFHIEQSHGYIYIYVYWTDTVKDFLGRKRKSNARASAARLLQFGPVRE